MKETNSKRRMAFDLCIRWIVGIILIFIIIFLAKSAEPQTAMVGVCQSNDKALGTSARSITDTLNYSEVDKITRLAIERAGKLDNIIQPGDWVTVKVNILCAPGIQATWGGWRMEGTCTDLRVVKSVIEQLIEEGDAKRITVVEGKTWRKLGEEGTPPDQKEDGWTVHWEHYDSFSYEDMLAELDTLNPQVKIDYIDLDYPPYTEMPVPGGGSSLEKYTIPDAILNCDRLIAIAVMKTHQHADVTLVHKLYIGISPASIYTSPGHYWSHFLVPHGSKLPGTIVDLFSYHPADLGIVECFWCMEGKGPHTGKTVKRNLVLASKDPVAVDAIASASMGFDPNDIEHLRLSNQKGFGVIDLDSITINGADLQDITRKFIRAR